MQGDLQCLRILTDAHANRHVIVNNENNPKLVVLIIHFPLEMAYQSRPSYQAIFLNQWDFVYIDSLGVSLTDSTFEVERVMSSMSVFLNHHRRKAMKKYKSPMEEA